MRAVTERNNFHCFARSCLHSGMLRSTSRSNIIGGWKASTAMKNRDNYQPFERTDQPALEAEGRQHDYL
eukprot:2907337-Amphidinium_carterae.1